VAAPARPAAAGTAGGDVAEILAAAAAAAAAYDRPDLVARLARAQASLAAPQCRVLVVGEFKKGKSSLVNALLNARVCAADADIATAVPTMVRWGAELSATGLTGEDDLVGAGDVKGQPVPLAQIEAAANGIDVISGLDNTQSDRAGQGRLRALDVTVPRQLLREGLVLVDTPGVGGGLASAHAAATLRALSGADVVLFVSDAGGEYTAPEIAFLRQAADLCPTVVCALTKIDFYPEWRRILAADQGHLTRAGLPYEIVPLSAPLRHHGVRAADHGLIMESGYPRLAVLLRAAVAIAGERAAATAAAAAQSALAQLVTRLSTEYGALRDPAEAGGQREAWTKARARAEQLKSNGSRWQQVLNDRVSDLASNVDLDLGQRLRAVRKEASDRIKTEDPSKGWAQLEPWLNQRTNEALIDHVRTIRDQSDEVADDVARQFGAAAWELQIAVDVSGTTAARDVALARVAMDRSARFQLGLMAARGGSVGIIVTHAVGMVLGLALPITLPATAVLATILSRKTWSGAKTSQLRALRAEAERAVATYLDEVELVARKDSRDSVRQVQRQLRIEFGQRATELFAATAQNLDGLTKAVAEDERTRKTRITEVGAELTRLRGLAARAGSLVDRLLAAPDATP
jgi:Dynamin family